MLLRLLCSTRPLNVFKPAFLILLVALYALLPTSAIADSGPEVNIRQLAQLAEYIGVDYSEAVSEGRVTHPGEYQEMQEFSQIIADASQQLPQSANLKAQALALNRAVQDKASLADVRHLTSALRRTLLELTPQASLPGTLLPEQEVRQLFATNCTACHGATGQGDGPMAASLEPAPTNFTDQERALNRSVLGLYDAIANGIEGTAMPAFSQLTNQQQWSIAFYVGSLAFTGAKSPAADTPAATLDQLVNYSPAQLARELPGVNETEIAALRAAPTRLFTRSQTPLALTRDHLNRALEAHHKGDYLTASNLAVSAYLDGFELIENNLDARDEKLRRNIEAGLMKLRQALARSQNNAEVDELMAATLQQLEHADQLLTAQTLSNSTLLTASFVILLREGLEALLVVLALATVLIRTERRDTLKFVHLGWFSALIAGGATWLAAQSLVTISGASRELMEGFAAGLAAIVLFYVGVWMHSKTHADHWQNYIQRNINSHLKAGTLWGIAGLAFVAVYREVFETVLFYQSLLVQAGTSQGAFVVGGFLLGVAALAATTWVLTRFSIRLPIGRFFAATTYLMLALAFILTGKAVSALQEAAMIPVSRMPFSSSLDWIGFNATWQGTLAQSTIVVLFIVFVVRSRLKSKAGSEALT
ncbi:MAG: FTR1 family protein [Pseudomonadales bacterium]